jgi:hypothetical protein
VSKAHSLVFKSELVNIILVRVNITLLVLKVHYSCKKFYMSKLHFLVSEQNYTSSCRNYTSEGVDAIGVLSFLRVNFFLSFFLFSI